MNCGNYENMRKCILRELELKKGRRRKWQFSSKRAIGSL
jgi:hypothetical protein